MFFGEAVFQFDSNQLQVIKCYRRISWTEEGDLRGISVPFIGRKYRNTAIPPNKSPYKLSQPELCVVSNVYVPAKGAQFLPIKTLYFRSFSKLKV